MLTLLVTVLATAYFVVPELITRFVMSFCFVRKASTGTRSEEILRAAFWATVPLCFAWFLRNVGWWRAPSGVQNSIETVFSCLFSDKIFAENQKAFFTAIRIFCDFNLCMLLRTYLIVFIGAALFGLIALQLGKIRAETWPWLNTALHWAFMPRISEWHVALSPILVRDRKELIVRIDVMTKGGTLYRGNVFEKRISGDGELATLILKNAERMIRDDFYKSQVDCEVINRADPAAAQPDTESYWRSIPGEMFLLNGSEISTVNVRHVRPVTLLKQDGDDDMMKVFAEIRGLLKDIKKGNASAPSASNETPNEEDGTGKAR